MVSPASSSISSSFSSQSYRVIPSSSGVLETEEPMVIDSAGGALIDGLSDGKDVAPAEEVGIQPSHYEIWNTSLEAIWSKIKLELKGLPVGGLQQFVDG